MTHPVRSSSFTRTNLMRWCAATSVRGTTRSSACATFGVGTSSKRSSAPGGRELIGSGLFRSSSLEELEKARHAPFNDTGVRMRRFSLIVLALAFALFAASCSSSSEDTTTTAAPADTTTTTAAATTTTAAATTTTTEAPAPDLGTADNPIRVLFVPSVDAQVITSGGEILADALNAATGLEYVVAVPT